MVLINYAVTAAVSVISTAAQFECTSIQYIVKVEAEQRLTYV